MCGPAELLIKLVSAKPTTAKAVRPYGPKAYGLFRWLRSCTTKIGDVIANSYLILRLNMHNMDRSARNMDVWICGDEVVDS